MKLSWIKKMSVFVVLLLVQVLIFNHVHLFDCATPMLYVYFILPIRRDTPRWLTLSAGFIMGLSVDIFANTPGLAAASLTFMAFLQPYLLALFVPRDSPDDLRPSFSTLGVVKYLLYTFLLVFVYCLAFFSIEAFSFFNPALWIGCIVGSTLLTLLLVWVIEHMLTAK